VPSDDGNGWTVLMAWLERLGASHGLSDRPVDVVVIVRTLSPPPQRRADHTQERHGQKGSEDEHD
jgi:hypothetical protein